LDNISTLQDLLQVLPQCSGKEYIELVKHINLDEHSFKGYESWSDRGYTRNLLARTENYELILLCWEKGQDTQIHCHNEQECWVYTAQGSFREKRFSFDTNTREMNLKNDMTLQKGQFSYMNDDMGYHSLENIHNGRTMSLHLYMNPITECRVYDADLKTLEWKVLHYDNVVESDK